MRLFTAVAAIAASCFPGVVCAQFTDPRTYTPGPVGLNYLEFDYTYARANASIDTSLVVGAATLELNKGALSYTHNFRRAARRSLRRNLLRMNEGRASG